GAVRSWVLSFLLLADRSCGPAVGGAGAGGGNGAALAPGPQQFRPPRQVIQQDGQARVQARVGQFTGGVEGVVHGGDQNRVAQWDQLGLDGDQCQVFHCAGAADAAGAVGDDTGGLVAQCVADKY